MQEIFSLPFMQIAMIASALSGIACSYLGVFVVLRRIVFVGIALAQISAMGVAVAVFFEQNPSLFAFIFTVAGGLLLSLNRCNSNIPKEVLIGVSFAAAWAFAILVLSKASHGEADMLNLVQGNILGADWKDVLNLVYVIIPVGIIHLVFYRKLVFTSFDAETASTLGINPFLFDFLFYVCLSLVVSASISLCGVLLTFSFLMIPGAVALLLGRSMKADFLISFVVSIFSSFAGIVISFKFDLPAGPSIVAVLSMFFAFAYVIRFFLVKPSFLLTKNLYK